MKSISWPCYNNIDMNSKRSLRAKGEEKGVNHRHFSSRRNRANSPIKQKNNLSLYANLVHRRQEKKDKKARERAEYLASLPKEPIKRFFYRLHPKRVLKYWFSKRGLFMMLKITVVGCILCAILIAAAFAYFSKDLNIIRPEELAKRVQTTVSKYYDRNGELLWEDKGTGDYKLVVDSSEISDYVKKATVAIEDREFFNHKGIDASAIARAFINNFRGGATQGGSTLTQQLIKQVYFAEDSSNRGLSGIPRKIKEIILAIQVEQIYNKDQILTLYLNESPYGGRRNGVESGAQTYFGKSAKNLTLSEAALLAAIPNNPAVYNPYNKAFNKSLVERQHKVLNDMAEVGFITKEEAEEAKKKDILAEIKPEVNQYANMKAPHFVQEVKKQLEKKIGIKIVGGGGLTVKTTLDLKAQKFAEQAVANGSKTLAITGADNIALTSVDANTGQVIAQVGSVDYHKEGYGQTNAAVSNLDPGSSIKPIVDYAPLFNLKDTPYTPGTVLRDENIDKLYCGGNTGQCKVRNYTGRFYGDVTIRQSLGSSLNIAAIKALSIVKVDKGIQTARDLGDLSYCRGSDAGLSAAIGGGCSVRQDEHTNAYATLARGGVYRPIAYVLEVKNSSGNKIIEWKDESKQAIDTQAAYMLTDILSDPNARSLTFGAQAHSFGFSIPGVWTASKTGTTDDSKGYAKDSWMMSYSPVVATGVWSGNHDGRALGSSSNTTVRRVVNDYMEAVHKQVYGPNGKWKVGDRIQRVKGISNCSIGGRNDICPSWWSKDKTNSKQLEIEVDTVSKRKATQCTPASTKTKITVYETTDPATKQKTLTAPDGYNINEEDNIHTCGDGKPSVSGVSYQRHATSNTYRINATITKGKFDLSSVEIKVDGNLISSSLPTGNQISVDYTFTKPGQTITVEIRDSGGYVDSREYSGPANISKQTTSDQNSN